MIPESVKEKTKKGEKTVFLRQDCRVQRTLHILSVQFASWFLK